MVIENKVKDKELGFNRKRFIEDILNFDFQGDVKQCAMRLNINPSYLHELVYVSSKDAGTKTLTKIYRYCMQTQKDPKLYIFRDIEAY